MRVGMRLERSLVAREGPLLERDGELELLERLLGEAAGGQARLVVVEGPAGIGKTRLIGEVRRGAAGRGFRVLSARGALLERDFPFGVVRQLLEGEVANAETQLLAGAAASARPVFESAAGEPAPADAEPSFASLHGLYWVVLNLCDHGPLLLVVDDAHWCDSPSLRFLAYVRRRLEGLAVLIACATRPSAIGSDEHLLAELTGDPGAVLIRPRPLSEPATRDLVGAWLPGPAEDRFSATCHRATGGNPLYLGELLRALAAERIPADGAHAGVVADLGPQAASRAVLLRLGRLPADAARAAKALAVLGDGADLASVAALAELDQERAGQAVALLSRAEIVRAEPPLAFVHPVVGAAIARDVPPGERELQHGRAARLLAQAGASVEQIAAHLRLAPAGSGEEWVCDVLERAARASLRAGSALSAAGYLSRALAEPPPDHRLANLLAELGRAEALTDGHAAVEHLTQALELTDDPRTRGTLALLLARVLLYVGRPQDSLDLILRTRSAAALDTEEDLRQMLDALTLIVPVYGTGDTATAQELARHRRLPPAAGAGSKMLAAAVARQWAYAGGPADACVELALAALQDGELIAADNVYFSVAAVLILALADRPEAARWWDALLQDARVRGSLVSKASTSLWRGYALYRTGELADAEASLRDAIEELTLWNNASEGRVQHAAFLSAVLLERGELAEAREQLATVGDPGDASDAARYWLDSTTQLLITEERFADALAVAEDFERRFEFLAHPLDTPARLHRAVALYHLGDRTEALAAGRQALELARLWGAPATTGRALRVLGTLEREAGLDHLHQAVTITEHSPAQLELAKSLVALGAALRAARRPTDARDPLRRAIDIADRLGAAPLLAHARSELYAAGGRPRTTALTGPGALTASERRIAERAAAGQTNRAIAAALFLAPKTIERHLANVYRKLGISRRTELQHALDKPD